MAKISQKKRKPKAASKKAAGAKKHEPPAVEAESSADPTDDLLADIDAVIAEDRPDDTEAPETDGQTVAAESVDDNLAEAAVTSEEAEADPGPLAKASEEVIGDSLEQIAEGPIEDAATETVDHADPVEAIMTEQAEVVGEVLESGEPIDEDALDHIVAEQRDIDDTTNMADSFDELVGDTEADFDAIASAFEEATSEINEVTREITDAVGVDENSGEPSTVYPPMTTPAPTGSSASLRDDLQTTRSTLQAALNNIAGLLDRLDDQHRETESRLRRAEAFQEAARQSYEASQEFGRAQIELGEARASYDKAQARIEIARRQWETARQAGDSAEVAVNADSATPSQTASANDSNPAQTASPESTCRIPKP